MESAEFSLATQTGQYDLTAAVRRIGCDLLVAVWGGEKPHIGAVAVAQPRSSLRKAQRTSASASVFCFAGHKEDQLARGMALGIAAGLNTSVVVTAGMHWDALAPAGIAAVEENSRILTHMILKRLQSPADDMPMPFAPE